VPDQSREQFTSVRIGEFPLPAERTGRESLGYGRRACRPGFQREKAEFQRCKHGEIDVEVEQPEAASFVQFGERT